MGLPLDFQQDRTLEIIVLSRKTVAFQEGVLHMDSHKKVIGCCPLRRPEILHSVIKYFVNQVNQLGRHRPIESINFELGMLEHTFNSSIWKAEAE